MIKVGLISPLVVIVETSKIWKLIAICGLFAATVIFLSNLSFQAVGSFGLWLGDISANVASDWFQFVGYVLNFSLIYTICTFYAFSFLTACITLFSLYIMAFVFAVFPECVNFVKKLLDSFTGD